MDEPRRILLVSPDLLATSRIAALGRECGATVETLRSLDERPPGPYDLVLVDLDANRGDPAVILARTRAALEGAARRPTGVPKLVAFGPHVHRQRLEESLAAGADEAVSRGELLGSFPALVRRWIG